MLVKYIAFVLIKYVKGSFILSDTQLSWENWAIRCQRSWLKQKKQKWSIKLLIINATDLNKSLETAKSTDTPIPFSSPKQWTSSVLGRLTQTWGLALTVEGALNKGQRQVMDLGVRARAREGWRVGKYWVSLGRSALNVSPQSPAPHNRVSAETPDGDLCLR